VPSSVFNLALAPSEDARDIWVRLKSETSRTAHFEVVRENDLLLLDARTMMWSAVYLGCLTIFGFWGCAQLFWRRDWLTITFLGFQAASVVYGAFVLGVVRLLVDGVDASKTTDQLTSLMVLVAVFMTLSFNTVLLREMLAPRWGLRAMVAGLCLYPVLLLLMLGGHVSTALQINMIVVLVAPVLAMVVALASRGGIGGVERAESPSARWFGLAYFLISMLLTMAAALPGLGLVEGSEITLHIIMLHGVATGFLMLAMLLYRIFRLLQQRELLAAEAAFGRRRVQQEQAFRHDRERLLAMLAHELKTPLSTIRMLLATLGLSTRAQVSAQAAVRDMNNVIERCLQVGQLDDGAMQVNWQPVRLGELARNVVASCSAASRVQLALAPGADPSEVPCVVSDPHLLEIVLRNLLDNALKYSPEGSVVTLALSDAGRGQVALAVGNDVGLAGKPDPEKVFSKYYRHGQAKRWTGSGLGLYLVHGLVGNLGGKMIYHDLGARVGFQVSLPREQERSCS
jgi:signal transduction histidine kinase